MNTAFDFPTYVALAFLAWNSWLDLRTRKISLLSVLCFFLLFLFACVLRTDTTITTAIAGVLPGFVLVGISLLSKGQIGMGDGLALMVLGLWTNAITSIQSLFWGLLLSSLFSLPYLIIKKRTIQSKTQKNAEIPFIPFLTAGYLIHLFFLC